VDSIPESWSIEQVTQWLSSIHLEKYIEKFKGKLSSAFFIKAKSTVEIDLCG
jgi:hypothetical protein